jgi:hypothetical protein
MIEYIEALNALERPRNARDGTRIARDHDNALYAIYSRGSNH